MKLFVSAILMAVDAQGGFGDGSDSFGAYDDFSLDGASYDDTYAGFTGPATDEERRRPTKGEIEDIAEESYSFGNYGDYGAFGDYDATADYGGFSDYNAYNAVEAVDTATGGFTDVAVGASSSAAAAGPGGREFEADTLGGQNIADDATAATRSCLTCKITALADFGTCTPKFCMGEDNANSVEDTRDYCLVELRQTNGAFDQLEMRCAEPKDCQSSFFNNVRGVDPTRHDNCRPIKDDSGVATSHYTGRWAHTQSLCRNCVAMNDGANGSGNYNIEVTGTTVKIHNKAGAALTDVTGNANVLTWSREMWHGGEPNMAYEKQNA